MKREREAVNSEFQVRNFQLKRLNYFDTQNNLYIVYDENGACSFMAALKKAKQFYSNKKGEVFLYNLVKNG